MNPKKILFFSEETANKRSAESILTAFEFTLDRASSIETFLRQWSRSDNCLAIVDTAAPEALLNHQPPLSSEGSCPLWLITDSSQWNTTPTPFFPLAIADFVQRPLTVETFQQAYSFWLHFEPIFSPIALTKLKASVSEDLAKKILESFVDSLKQAHTQIIISLENRDLEKVEKYTHAVKASAKLVGAQALYNLCSWVETKKRTRTPLTERFSRQAKLILDESLNAYLRIPW